MTYRGDDIKYKYKFKITGRTLIINIEMDGAYSDKAVEFELDRCEHVKNPAAIAIPYLPLFYILYGNNSLHLYYQTGK